MVQSTVVPTARVELFDWLFPRLFQIIWCCVSIAFNNKPIARHHAIRVFAETQQKVRTLETSMADFGNAKRQKQDTPA